MNTLQELKICKPFEFPRFYQGFIQWIIALTNGIVKGIFIYFFVFVLFFFSFATFYKKSPKNFCEILRISIQLKTYNGKWNIKVFPLVAVLYSCRRHTSIFNFQFSIPKSLYPTCEPLGTLSVGASKVSLPVASADIRIIPCEVIPLSSRGRRFTSTKIWRPTSSSGV